MTPIAGEHPFGVVYSGDLARFVQTGEELRPRTAEPGTPGQPDADRLNRDAPGEASVMQPKNRPTQAEPRPHAPALALPAARAQGTQRALFAAGYAAALVLTVLTAIVAKEAASGARPLQPLAAITPAHAELPTPRTGFDIAPLPMISSDAAPVPSSAQPARGDQAAVPSVSSDDIRWFDARPIRPARTVMMTVTAYSPDARSCGEFADGQTATLHSVWTNGMRLVAADPKVLPYGSMLTVPGYAEDSVVPVLDCGGAIKGDRLDLMFPTHEAALQWGVKRIPVTVWEYADGQPAPNVRKVR